MNPYTILGVVDNDSDDRLKRRYRTVCKMYHPDKHANDKTAVALFQIIKDAYEKIKFVRKKIVVGDVEIETESTPQQSSTSQTPGSHAKHHVLGHVRKDPWFHQGFNLVEYFGNDCFPTENRHSTAPRG